MHESKLSFVSGIEFIRSILSDFSAHVFGVTFSVVKSCPVCHPPGYDTVNCQSRSVERSVSFIGHGVFMVVSVLRCWGGGGVSCIFYGDEV